MKVKPITWKDGRFSSVYGFIGPARVAIINYSLERDDPTPWRLTVSGVAGESRTGYESVPFAKAAAADILLSMVRRLVDE